MVTAMNWQQVLSLIQKEIVPAFVRAGLLPKPLRYNYHYIGKMERRLRRNYPEGTNLPIECAIPYGFVLGETIRKQFAGEWVFPAFDPRALDILGVKIVANGMWFKPFTRICIFVKDNAKALRSAYDAVDIVDVDEIRHLPRGEWHAMGKIQIKLDDVEKDSAKE